MVIETRVRRIWQDRELVPDALQSAHNKARPEISEHDNPGTLQEESVNRMTRVRSNLGPELKKTTAVEMHDIRDSKSACDPRQYKLPIDAAAGGGVEVQKVYLSAPYGEPESHERSEKNERTADDAATASGGEAHDANTEVRTLFDRLSDEIGNTVHSSFSVKNGHADVELSAGFAHYSLARWLRIRFKCRRTAFGETD